jgi:hypothetical protein
MVRAFFHPRTGMSDNRPPLTEDLARGWAMALGLCALASVPIGIGALIDLGKLLTGRPPSLGQGDWLVTTLTVFASYYVAATLASPIYWLTRPLRPSAFGYAFTGMLITPIIYGSVAMTGYLAWEPAGRIIFGRGTTTRHDFLAMMPLLLAVFTVLGIPAGLYWWKKDEG